MFLKYSGKNVLILGGSCEIGLETSRVLIKQNLNVFSTFRTKEGRRKIEMTKSTPIHLDLADKKTISNVTLHSYDYLIDFIHTDYESLISSVNSHDISNYFNLNVVSKISLLKEISRDMILKKCGRVIYISSAATILPAKGQGFYVSSKKAMESIYGQLGIELISKGITSLNLKYGYIKSGRGKKYLKSKGTTCTFQALSTLNVANQIAFFLSEDATSINATSITIDSGLSASKSILN